MTVAVPAATPVKITGTEQLAVVDKVQLAPTVPTAVFDDTKFTEPVGVLAAFVISVTVAVQLEVPPAAIVVGGPQVTLVAVLSLAVTVPVTVAARLTLPL